MHLVQNKHSSIRNIKHINRRGCIRSTTLYKEYLMDDLIIKTQDLSDNLGGAIDALKDIVDLLEELNNSYQRLLEDL